MQLYAQYAQEASLRHKVAAVHGGITSASREVIRPVLDKYRTPVLLRTTRLGLLARGTMQNAEMAAALGTDTSRVYAVTFAFGAALAGFAGGVLAPVSGVFPSIGGSYIGRAFITVIGGGASPRVGAASASTLFGIINQIATFASNPVYGEVALLLAAILLIRAMPQGITGRYFRGRL